MRRIRERKHRLPPDSYRGQAAASFTLCIQDRRSIFNNPFPVPRFVDILMNSLQRHLCDSPVYLFMPDHMHLVLQGTSAQSDLRQCVVSFKQASGFWFRREMAGIRWQKDFYDHILRKDEDLVKHLRYVLDNPVRKGLVTDWRAYPFKGSTVFDLDSW
ncbi:MAG: transposase [Nitrospirae bacterium]|nr:transposase [Nitrospirota bacterium]